MLFPVNQANKQTTQNASKPDKNKTKEKQLKILEKKIAELERTQKEKIEQLADSAAIQMKDYSQVDMLGKELKQVEQELAHVFEEYIALGD